MNKVEIELLTEKLAEGIKGHVRGVADTIKEYVRKEVEALEERLTDKRADATETKEYVRREEPEEVDPRLIRAPGPQHVQANKSANAGTGSLDELAGTARNLERRAGRHAEHLLKLESRVRTLEGKKNES